MKRNQLDSSLFVNRIVVTISQLYMFAVLKRQIKYATIHRFFIVRGGLLSALKNELMITAMNRNRKAIEPTIPSSHTTSTYPTSYVLK